MSLTHWGRVMYICVGNFIIIGSYNGLSSGRRQAIIWTNAVILLIGPLGTNFNLVEIHIFSFKKKHLKLSSAKWHPCCFDVNVLTECEFDIYNCVVFDYEPVVVKTMVWQSVGFDPYINVPHHCTYCTHVVYTLHWRHNDYYGVSNHQPHGCFLNRLFRRRSKKTSKCRVTGLCVGNSPGPVNSPHKGSITRKMFSIDDVIMQ